MPRFRTALAALVVAATLAATPLPAADAVAPAGREAARPAAAEPAKPAKFRGRLPRYYGKVVDAVQRQQIYQIQAKYHERLEALKAQLKQLEAQCDAEIEGVLSPEQKQSLAKLLADAAAARQTAATTNDK